VFVEVDGRRYELPLIASTQPAGEPATQPATQPATRPAGDAVVVVPVPDTQPATTRPTLAERVPFDQRGARVGVVINRGEHKTIENLAPFNIGGSFVETTLFDGSVLTIRNVKIEGAKRYGVYVEGRKWEPGWPLVAQGVAGTLIMENVEVGASADETPIRMLEGIHGILRDVRSVVGSAGKNNQCLRAHGYITEIYGGEFGWSIFGPQSDAKNPVDSRSQLVLLKGVKFNEGIRFTKGIEKVVIEDCEIDLGANWLNKHTGGHVQDVRTQILIRNTAIRGPPDRIDFGNSDVGWENSTINGKPAK
jgi:hypothetical protein